MPIENFKEIQEFLQINVSNTIQEEPQIIKCKEDKDKTNLEFSYLNTLYQMLANIATVSMWYFILLIEVHFVGLTENTRLQAALQLGIQFCNIFWTFAGFGIGDSIGFLSAKSFGNKNYKLQKIQIYQVRIIATIFFLIFLITSTCFSTQILRVIAGRDKLYIEEAHIYILYSLPSLYLEIHFEIGCKHLESMSTYSPIAFSLIFGMVCHPINCYIFLIKLDYGIYGVVLSQFITQCIKLFILEVSFYFNSNNIVDIIKLKLDEIIDKKTFLNTLQAAFFSMICTFSDGGSQSLNSLNMSSTSELIYNQYIVLLCITQLNETLCIGLMNTVCVLSSQWIGANHPTNLKRTIIFLFYTGLLVEILILIFVYFFRISILNFFTSVESIYLDPNLHNLVILVCITNILDFLGLFMSGVMRAVEFIKFLSFISVLLILFAIPISSYILIHFYHFSIKEVLISFIVIYSLFCIMLFTYLLANIEYEKICEKYNFNAILEKDDSSLDEEADITDSTNITSVEMIYDSDELTILKDKNS